MNTELQDQPYRQLALDIHAGASPFLEVRLAKQDDLDPQAIAQQLEQELNHTIERVLGSNQQLHLGRRLRVTVHPLTDMHYRTDLERWQEWTKSLDALRQDSAAELAWHEQEGIQNHPDNGKFGYWLISGIRHQAIVQASSAPQAAEIAMEQELVGAWELMDACYLGQEIQAMGF